MEVKNKAVIYDLDGTLWDSSREVVEAWNIVLARYPHLNKQITVEDMHSYMGKNIFDIFRLILPDVSKEERNSIMEESIIEQENYLKKHGGTLYKGVLEMLARLKDKYKLIIVSNCQDGYAQTFLDYTKLWDEFCDFEVHGRTGMCKGDNIKLVMERNGIEKAVYVGDTKGDSEAAQHAGVPFIYASYGFGEVEKPLYVAKNIQDVVEMAEEILG
ncbi:MAG: HAD family hydrolase [Lachnospiraceae bacterium]|nr:HAD family hydrolase [Lachnospiraceae bacterium]